MININDKIYIDKIQKSSAIKKKLHPKILLPKVGVILINLVQLGPRVIMRSALQLLRVNIYTRIITSFLVLVFDTFNYLTHRISKKQFIINAILSLSLVIGGTAGWYGGEFLVRDILIENTALWFIACIVLSGTAGAMLEKFISNIIYKHTTSDMEEMLKHYNKAFVTIISDQNIPEEDAQSLSEKLYITEGDCINCYKSKDKEKYTYNIINQKLRNME